MRAANDPVVAGMTKPGRRVPLQEATLLGAHASALVPPLLTLAYLATAPHSWAGRGAVLAVAAVLVALDRPGSGPVPAVTGATRMPFELLLVLSASIQALNVLLLVTGTAGLIDITVSVLLVGAGSAYSAVIVAHEWIHAPGRLRRWAGRVLLWPALYDHFSVEHLRGHHRRVATDEDALTARRDETFWRYLARSVPGEMRSAWRLAPGTIAAGVAMQASIVLALGALGPVAPAVFLAQAAVAQLLIGTVNYLQHWGLRRRGGRVQAVDSWESDAALSRFLLFGLARHPAHHARSATPFYELTASAESPVLPAGFLAMAPLVLVANGRARRLLVAELHRKGLGKRDC